MKPRNIVKRFSSRAHLTKWEYLSVRLHLLSIAMPNWIAVDNETSSALRSRLPEQSVIDLIDGSALELALSRNPTTVAVLPCRGLGQATLAVFRWNRIPVTPPLPPPQQANIRAGGFLGLRDEVFEEESQEKKSWWKRFWES